MNKYLNKLISYTGEIISEVSVEIYLYVGDSYPTISSVEIKFRNNASLLFGCSGNGSISIIKSKAKILQNSAYILKGELKRIDTFSNRILNCVTPKEESLILEINGDILELENNGDELTMLINNKYQQLTI